MITNATFRFLQKKQINKKNFVSELIADVTVATLVRMKEVKKMCDFGKDTATAGTMAVSEAMQYEQVLKNGTKVKFHFGIESENFSRNDFHQLLEEFAQCSRNFYLVFGKKTIN